MRSIIPFIGLLIISSQLMTPITLVNEMETLQSPDSYVGKPSQENSESASNIVWPRLGNPAILLNGSNFEILLKGPANITSWSVVLYREYVELSLTFDIPKRTESTGIWNINASIPANSPIELFDLVVSVSDNELIERNAVHIRNSFPSDFTVVQISDPHVSADDPDADTRLLSALYQASAARADLVIITGDLVQIGNERSFQRVYDLVAQSSVPVFLGPGNHDVSDGQGYGNYMSFFGEDYYTANIGPDIFVIMTNSHDGELNSTQIEWIERDVSACNAQTKILCIHHPLATLRFYDSEGTSELIRICNENNVDVVLTGHSHSDQVEKVDRTLWIRTTSIGAHPATEGNGYNGFRVIEFQDGTPTKWNWTTNKPWSQPWDSVMLTRHPMKFHDIDVGAYLEITNNLNYSITNQVLNFIVQPMSGNRHYIASGADVVSIMNGTDGFLIRMSVNLDESESTTVRIYPSDAEIPSLLSVGYPASVVVGEEYTIKANLTNPSSGILDVYLDVKFNDISIDRYEMSSSDGREWSTSLSLNVSGEYHIQIRASDYSGLEFSSPLYPLECLEVVQPLEIGPILIFTIGLVSAAIGTLVVRRKNAP